MTDTPERHGIWIDYVDIRTLRPDPDNPKDHDIGAIDESISEFGFLNPMGINEETGYLVYGHGRLEDLLAKQDRKERPPANVREENGKWLAPVVRGVHLTPDRARAYVIADNQLTILGGWNEPKLLENLLALAGPTGEGSGLRGTGFDPADVDQLARMLKPTDHEPGLHIDQAEKLQSKWGTALGQIWTVPSKALEGASHRIMCGDATNAEHLASLLGDKRATLVVSDPPYGIDHVRQRSGVRTRPKEGDATSEHEHYDKIGGDALQGEEFKDFLASAFRALLPVLADDSAWYIWHASNNRRFVEDAMEAIGAHIHQDVIWKKDKFYMGRSDYHWQHEAALYGWRGKHNWFGDRRQSTVWEVRRDLPHEVVREGESIHPTIKPVALYMIAMRNSSRLGEAILDPFAGSGPLVVAAERTGRLGHALELSPKYVAVILQRCREMGLEPRLT